MEKIITALEELKTIETATSESVKNIISLFGFEAFECQKFIEYRDIFSSILVDVNYTDMTVSFWSPNRGICVNGCKDEVKTFEIIYET